MTDFSSYLAFMVFVFVMTGTPGPGNMAFMAVGAAAGPKAALRPILGAVMSSSIMDVMIAFGLGAVLMQGGWITILMKTLCMGYMFYLAWRIVTMERSNGGDGRILSFWEGALIHPLSPKTWAMGVIGFSVYFNPTGSLWDEAAILASGFAIGGLVSHTSWAFVGSSIIKLLGKGHGFRIFTASMAALMLSSTAISLFMKA